MKQCARCKRALALEEFTILHGKPHSYCRPCKNAHQAEYRQRTAEHARARDRRRHADPERRAAHLLMLARQRAGEKGLPFDLTSDWLLPKLQRGVCEVTGLPIEMLASRARAWGPSLDRTDNSRGYTQDNVKLVCWMYNAAKGVSTHEDVMKLAGALCRRT